MLPDQGESGAAAISALLRPEVCADLASRVEDTGAGLAALDALKQALQASGLVFAGDSFERAFLGAAAVVFEPQIENVPVHASVRARLRDEFRYYTRPAGQESLRTGTYLFSAACKVISLRRFPAGPMEWEISGIPRSWLVRFPKRDMLRAGLFIWRKLGGFYPLFFLHVARRPRNRSLILEKEVARMYYRTARSLELQPEVRGIMASAWFHDPEAVRVDPHLSILSRPYLEQGGLITTTGPAPPDAGFLEHNNVRKELLESGRLHYELGLALWPRKAAIEWACQHPELED